MSADTATRSPMGARTPSALLTSSSHPAGASTPNYFDFEADPDSNPPHGTATSLQPPRRRKGTTGSSHGGVRGSPGSAGVTPHRGQSSREFQQRLEYLRQQAERQGFNLSHGALLSGPMTQMSLSAMANGGSSLEPQQQAQLHSIETQILQQQQQQQLQNEQQPDPMDLDSAQSTPTLTYTQSPPAYATPPLLSPASTHSLDHNFPQRSQSASFQSTGLPVRETPPRVKPAGEAGPTTPTATNPTDRSSTMPAKLKSEQPALVAPSDLHSLLKDTPAEDILLLDLRVFASYAQSHIAGALNLCIPTTLLKRASFNVKRLSETFNNKGQEKEKFDSWRRVATIVVYDGASWTLPEAAACVNILRKFRDEGWSGQSCVLKGGFNAFAPLFPDLITATTTHDLAAAQDSDDASKPTTTQNGSKKVQLSIDTPATSTIAGGCSMPMTNSGPDPFFGTIRQNMDLVDGVGQLPVRQPKEAFAAAVDEAEWEARVPVWLRVAADEGDHGKTVASKFLAIEQDEQARMQQALSTKPTPNAMADVVQIAGLEKGIKNRYKDILPFEHARVKLQGPAGVCDYVNASHITTQRSAKHYIATQAPIPATFCDFWRVVWQEGARVVVMLTPESEGCMVKSHPYWLSGRYGDFSVELTSERRVFLDDFSTDSGSSSIAYWRNLSSMSTARLRPDMPRRHSSKPTTSTSKNLPALSTSTLAVSESPRAASHRHSPSTPTASSTFSRSMGSKSAYSAAPPFPFPSSSTAVPASATTEHPDDSNPDRFRPHVTVRTCLIRPLHGDGAGYTATTTFDSDAQGQREVTQVQYTQWPDLGAPAEAGEVLGIVNLANQLNSPSAFRGDASHIAPRGAAFSASAQQKASSGSSSSRSRERPLVVHCSAGCGRTGTFCTIDTVIDMLAQNTYSGARDVGDDLAQQQQQQRILLDEQEDLVASTVAEFRQQRLSMVQTLRQFVLCYESVLAWVLQ